MSITMRSALLIAVLGVFVPFSCYAGVPAKHDIRGAALGMSLGDAMEALARNGGVCGKGVFDTHRCDFDSDTWVHLHAVGTEKTVQAIKYTFAPLNDQSRFTAFKAKVVDIYHLDPVDNIAKFVTPEGNILTVTDGEIDLETATNAVSMPTPDAVEPKL